MSSRLWYNFISIIIYFTIRFHDWVKYYQIHRSPAENNFPNSKTIMVFNKVNCSFKVHIFIILIGIILLVVVLVEMTNMEGTRCIVAKVGQPPIWNNILYKFIKYKQSKKVLIKKCMYNWRVYDPFEMDIILWNEYIFG